MKMMIKRNLLLFFRDRTHVFFSMLAVLITILLYIIFLADLTTGMLANEMPHATHAEVRLVTSGLILSGTIAVATVTSCLSGMTRLVVDREIVAKDFFVSPLARNKLMFSYIVSSSLIGFIMSGLSLITTLIYLSVSRGSLPSLTNLALLLISLILGVASANSMMFLLTCLIKSRNAFGSLGSIIGTLIGFLSGVYIPVGQLPTRISWIVRLFPTAHTASMFRQILAGAALEDLLYHAPDGTLTWVQQFFGVNFNLGGYTTSFLFSTILLLVTTTAFYIAGLFLMKKTALTTGLKN